MTSPASDRTYVEDNARELERMRAVVQRLGEADLNRQVNEHWTVAAVLGHIAFWDGRALALAEKLARGRSFTPSDEEPDDPDWINDATRPLIHAIPSTEAARVALRIAQETDERMATLPPELAAQGWPHADESPLNLARSHHRAEHLDEIEAALGG
jgi:hypothetical protein